MFSNMMYTTEPALIELFVPVGSKSKYQSDSFWGQFTNIVEDETLGMSPILSNLDDDKPNDVYDLSGKKVKAAATSLDNLPKSVYINSGKKVIIGSK